MSGGECVCAALRAEGGFPGECEVHVACDDWCGALIAPVTLTETRSALEHWRDHSYLSGCSHAC